MAGSATATVVTFGLWATVWIIRAVQGNRRWIWEPAPGGHHEQGAS
jgi:hypothetical protein